MEPAPPAARAVAVSYTHLKVVTSREELLDTARQIVFQEGIDQLSIRTLAKKQNISVGAVYNYFPSKADLLLAIVESFWKGIFHKDICTLSETLPFADFYEVVYLRLAEHMEDFFSVLLGQLDILRNTEKAVSYTHLDVYKRQAYDEAGINAISILTERNYFQGGLENIAIARSVSDLPILRKDRCV